MATGGSLSYSPNFHPLSAALLFLGDGMSESNCVIIPIAVFERSDLTWFDKALVGKILSLEVGIGCSASNLELAKHMQSTATSVANAISGLRSFGLIQDVKFDGRTRWIKINQSPK